MDVLGISCFGHDAAAVLLRDGVVVAAAEEERFSRTTHDASFPALAIDFCLDRAGIRGADLDYVAFFEKPFRKFERMVVTALASFPHSRGVFQESMRTWFTDKLWVQGLIKDRLGVPGDRILFSEHHLSHAASAYLCSPYDEAAILTVDGVGEWATATYGVGKGNELRILEEIRFPHSLGLLYSAFTAFLGFAVNEGESKVMGMAPFGEPRYRDQVYKLVQVEDDGSFALDMDAFAFHRSPDQTFGARFERLFGAPRDPGTPFFTDRTGYPAELGPPPDDVEARAADNQRFADIAASIQLVTEEVLLKMVDHLHRQTGLRRLCMAGGVALNAVANARILRESPFEELYIQPAAGDGGGALGAALWAYHTVLGQPRRVSLEHAYWGADHGPGDVEAFLASSGIAYERPRGEDALLDAVVDALAAGQVVGWVQGRFEWGPRALGNRSILADPRRADMRDVVNAKIKFREPFHSFAPSVPEECAEEYFDLPDAKRHYPARFMLYVVDVKRDKRAILPAITHVDGTARLQTVRRETNPRYYRLLERFGMATGVPVLLNTSLNLTGEPIANTPAEAFSTFSRSGLDMLVLGDCIVTKPIVQAG